MKSGRSILCLSLAVATLTSSQAASNKAGGKSQRKADSKVKERVSDDRPSPNILFIFGDQWRRMALSLYKDNKDYNMGDPVKTPNVDALAEGGVVYDNSYCTSPLSCPNRATLITGKYTHTHGLTDNTHADDFTLDNVTIAHILEEQGYNTGYLGKWHLANHHKNKNKYLDKENRRGFQYWYGNEMCHNHFDGIFMHCAEEIDRYYDGSLPNKFMPSKYYANEIREDEKWMPNHLTRKAVEYLDNSYEVRDVEKPFICFVSYSPPHTIHGPVPKDTPNGEESYTIAGTSMVEKNGREVPLNYGKTGRLADCGYAGKPNAKAAPNEYRAPNAYEAPYREGGKFDGKAVDLGKRPNVSDYYYGHSNTAYPGYFGAVNSLDDCIGRIIETLKSTDDVRYPGHKLIDNTIIVITADHGDSLGSHDTMGKGSYTEESVGVPLVIYWKDMLASNMHKKTIFNSVDMTPTLLGMLGIEKKSDMEGSDLSADVLSTEVGSPDQYAFMRLTTWVAVRHKNYVCGYDQKKGQTYKLYDLEADPFQMNPITIKTANAEQKEMLQHLKSKIAEFLADTKDNLLAE